MSIRSSASARTRHSAASCDASPQSIASLGSKIPLSGRRVSDHSSSECVPSAATPTTSGQWRAARGTFSTKNMANRIIAALKSGDAGPHRVPMERPTPRAPSISQSHDQPPRTTRSRPHVSSLRLTWRSWWRCRYRW